MRSKGRDEEREEGERELAQRLDEIPNLREERQTTFAPAAQTQTDNIER